MDWCVDLRIAGAADFVVRDVVAQLERHAELADVVDLAEPLVREAVAGDAASPMRWIAVSWDGSAAKLEVADLASDGPWPQPGPLGPPLRVLGPGVALAHEAVVELRAATLAGPVTIELPVVRAPQATIDPAPLATSAAPADQHHFLTAALGLFAREDLDNAGAETRAAQLGATVASGLSADIAAGAGLREAVDAIIDFERRAGGEFFLVEADDATAVIGNHVCPFGDAARDAPSLCRVTSALAGRLAAHATGGDVTVSLPERLATGDHQCRLVLGVGSEPNPTAHAYGAEPAGVPSPPPPDPDVAEGLQVALSMRLPRDQLSVPLVRRLTRHALEEVGVVDDDRGDVELAVTEAAANVMQHAGPGDAYDVNVEINPTTCEIRVIDVGRGFDHEGLDASMADRNAEEGRGIALMHALMDQVRFTSHPERGTIVHLVKELHFDDSAPARALMLAELRDRRRSDPTGGS